jgi:hypothetical protein
VPPGPKPLLNSLRRNTTLAHGRIAYAVLVLSNTAAILSQRIGDKNIVPFIHVFLAYRWSLAHVPDALAYVQQVSLRESSVRFPITLGCLSADQVHNSEFPQPLTSTGRQLPKDFLMRGLIFGQHYFPVGFFRHDKYADEDEHILELPKDEAPRAERCLWFGVQMAPVSYTLPLLFFDTNALLATSLARESSVVEESSRQRQPCLRRRPSGSFAQRIPFLSSQSSPRTDDSNTWNQASGFHMTKEAIGTYAYLSLREVPFLQRQC